MNKRELSGEKRGKRASKRTLNLWSFNYIFILHLLLTFGANSSATEWETLNSVKLVTTRGSLCELSNLFNTFLITSLHLIKYFNFFSANFFLKFLSLAKSLFNTSTRELFFIRWWLWTRRHYDMVNHHRRDSRHQEICKGTRKIGVNGI